MSFLDSLASLRLILAVSARIDTNFFMLNLHPLVGGSEYRRLFARLKQPISKPNVTAFKHWGINVVWEEQANKGFKRAKCD
jgi:hypothetical protein